MAADLSKRLKDLEKRINFLQNENVRKEDIIKRLSISSSSTTTASSTSAADASSSSSASASASTPAPAPALVIDPSKPIVKIVHKEPTSEEKVEYAVYDDDPALGKNLPVEEWDSLAWHNLPEGATKVSVGGGKPVVMTFFSNLNKGDYVTLSVLSELKRDSRFSDDKITFCAISRDGDKEDVPKFLRKVNGNTFGELFSTDGSPGVTIIANYPLAYDEGDKFNKMMKKIMVKGTVGVGMVIVVDGDGIIRWYEKFVRGVNPMNQLESVLESVIAGEPISVSNGKKPLAVDEEDLEVGEIPDDAFGDDEEEGAKGEDGAKKDGY